MKSHGTEVEQKTTMQEVLGSKPTVGISFLLSVNATKCKLQRKFVEILKIWVEG
jgi:hypothetical protein